jgi:hypothetical protein
MVQHTVGGTKVIFHILRAITMRLEFYVAWVAK